MNIIQTYREARGTSRSWLARKIGVSRMTIVNWEKGVYKPKKDKAKALGEELGFDWRLLYEDEI